MSNVPPSDQKQTKGTERTGPQGFYKFIATHC